MDAISQGSRNVSILLSRKLSIPPVPIRTVKKNNDDLGTSVESPMYQAVELVNKVDVYEIWKVFLEENEDELDFVFVIISAECILNGYRNAEWEDVKYEGFYTTIEEAQNEIKGYIR